MISQSDWSEYLTTPGLNWSRLKHMARSPAHYHWHLTEPTADTDDLSLGRATHVAILEPEKLKRQYVTWPDRRAGRAYEEFCAKAKASGKEVLTMKQEMLASLLAMSVRKHAVASSLLRGGRAEMTVTFTASTPSFGDLPGMSWPAKARIDYLSDSGIVDLKSARDGGPDPFGRAAWNLGYLGQAAWYVDAVKQVSGKELPFFFVVVEKTAPYVVQPYRVSDELLEIGREHYQNLLARLALCERTNSWPGYSEGIALLEVPRWVERDDDEDLSETGIEFNDDESENAHAL